MAKILLIENRTRLGVFVGMTLMDAGHDVGKVDSPVEVAERLSTSEPDLAIFNTGLDVREKSEFITAWREMRPNLKVLEISEDPLIEGRAGEDLARFGAPDVFLQIPFDLSELEKAVAEMTGTTS